MKISVIGLGKIGLPLAAQYASKGHFVTGIDTNQTVVNLINSGNEPFPGEHALQEKLSTLVPSGHLRATSDYSLGIPEADVIVIVVPLLVDEDTWQPDFKWMDSATESIAKHLTANTLVSYETTLPVGTTRSRWKPMLEAGSGLIEGEDFHVVFSPERVLTGRVFADLRRYPKLVGGLSDEGTQEAIAFYNSVLDFDERNDLSQPNGVWNLGSAEAAEMAKLAETTYRDVNIGLANQFAIFADKSGIDIYKVIEACNSQPYSHIHIPGIAVGGHCIPVYPRLYLSTDPEATVVRAARDQNTLMPEYVVAQIEKELGPLSGMRAVVLGAAYRGGVKETAVSGVFETVIALERRFVTVYVHDPLFTDHEIEAMGFTPFSQDSQVDIVIIQADHVEYRGLTSEDFPGVRILADGRNITAQENWLSVPRITVGSQRNPVP